jgi:Pyruvate/2-oxoacid:ferredoxin oxidoreductase gamma subunit
MVGFVAAVTRIVDRESMRRAVAESVPAGTETLNLRAFDAGWDYYEEHYGDGESAPDREPVTAGSVDG